MGCLIGGIVKVHLTLSVKKNEMEEYSVVKKMFSNDSKCVREAIYDPFRIADPLGN